MPRMTTAEAVIESLLQHGIDTLYALPGVHNDHLFDAAHKAGDRLRVIHARHEQTAAYMALGAALVTGKPQAFAVVPGPGLLNASAALLTAYGMGAPVIALVGQIASFAIDQGHGHLHEIHDQLGLLRHITRHAARIRTPHEAPALVDEAIRIACDGRSGPVALECAIDVWGSAAEVAFPPPATARRPAGRSRRRAACRRVAGQGRTPADRGGRRRPGRRPRGAGRRRSAASPGVVVPPRPRRHPHHAPAGRLVHRGPRAVERRRRRPGDRHAALLAAEQLGRGRQAADHPPGHRPGGDQPLPPPRLRPGRRCRDRAARAAGRTAGAQPRARPHRRTGGGARRLRRAPGAASSRRWRSCAPSAPRCPTTAFTWRRSRRSASPAGWRFRCRRRGPFCRRGIRTRSAGATAPRSAHRPRRRGARWCWRPAMAGSCTRRRNSPPRCVTSCRSSSWCSTTARSAMCAASSRSITATG